ncbi:MAG: 5-(carboxyamino)imidazole ribonucleotide synthase [Alphaproteobacteria bacterium]|nr:5-(carboxyamino)imidazole ribonucleotide synthase [Alphaproteobacteria bacterium]HPF47084.1 5-(carboxyamino)imidazole ribonucleotide synthase [Emcibacteraceae bacterium]HRW30557.1 5-(carboxyamino)imidazole ribonucleotide synthase [Emcibacteraceae bacterium]
MNVLSPGSTIGILGGGQLGRMLSIAASRLGYKCHIYCPEINSPAAQVSALTTHAYYEDTDQLEKFARSVDVITYEFENIPVATVDFLTQRKPVFPGSKVLEVSQDRLKEKEFINSLGIETAPFNGVSDIKETLNALETINYPAVLKTRRLGYDGKGQAILKSQDDLKAAWDKLGSNEIILEGFVDFELEISVIAARGQDGEIKCYVPVENKHKNHILDISIAPARIDDDLKQEAVFFAKKIIENIDYVGVLTVEFFVSSTEPRLRVNEIAPRVHNSGHWTIEACATSQFEQHIRAICGLPLGEVDFNGEARMINLIGEDILQFHDLVSQAENYVHHYGKSEVKAGRKMGHITRLYQDKN